MANRKKNVAGKSRTKDNPYLTLGFGSWEHRILKAWQADPYKLYGRVFCAVKSDFTFGSYDHGDVYVHELRGTYGPQHVKQYDESLFGSAEEAFKALIG